MSDQPDNELSFDLQFLPDWAQDDVGKNKYANHSGEDRHNAVAVARAATRSG